jgi:hypothetical protein
LNPLSGEIIAEKVLPTATKSILGQPIHQVNHINFAAPECEIDYSVSTSDEKSKPLSDSVLIL